MIKIFSLVIFLLASFVAISQTTDIAIANPNDTTIYTTVDSVATFPGGRPAWNKYLVKYLNAGVGVDNGAGKGTYNVVIKFIVMKDGTLKDFQPETKYGYGFEEETIRVLKLSPKWIPAKKNGVIVNSVTRQTQVFNISVE
jgi:hypothetical protein